MCPQRLARIDRFLAERRDDAGRLPNALGQIAPAGRRLHRSVLGRASLEAGAPLPGNSIVRICSMTEPVTSIAFVVLVAEGRFALDAPVHR